MSNSILYYPTIEFCRKDYLWLWNASLFADKIYRIVPPEYCLNEPRNIRELCSTGEIGIPISPVPYSKEASQDFFDFMNNYKSRAAALSLIEEDETEYIRIHSSKMDVKLLKDIFFKLKKIDEDENWLYAEPNTVNFYMTFLANHIAKKNSLSLWTRNQELWTTSTYFLHDGGLQESYFPGDIYLEPSAEALVSIMIPNIFPQGLIKVSPEEILNFREKRRDERTQFLAAIEQFKNKISLADAPEVIQAIVSDEKRKVDNATTEYKKSMDILRVVKFGGILTTAITIAADALGYCNNFPDLYKGILGSSGLWAGILTGIAEKKVSKTKNPYTYLAHINSTFSLYPDTNRFFTDQPFVSKYNYTLYRGFEEFIND